MHDTNSNIKPTLPYEFSLPLWFSLQLYSSREKKVPLLTYVVLKIESFILTLVYVKK